MQQQQEKTQLGKWLGYMLVLGIASVLVNQYLQNKREEKKVKVKS